MKISLIIPVCNSRPSLERLLLAICSYKERPSEIIVVDDGSDESILDLQTQYPVLIYELNNNFGAGYARNYGSKKATGDIFLFVDSDVIPKSNYLNVVRNELENSSSEIGGCGGRYLLPELIGSPIDEFSHYQESLYWDLFYPRAEVNVLYGGLCAFKKEAWFCEHRSYQEHLLFKNMASGEDTFVCQEIRKSYKLIYSAGFEGDHYSDLGKRFFNRSLNQAYSRSMLILTNNIPKVLDEALFTQSVPGVFLGYLLLLLGFFNLYFILGAIIIFIFSYRTLLSHFKIKNYPYVLKYAFLQQAGWLCGLIKAINVRYLGPFKSLLQLGVSGYYFLFKNSFNRMFFFVTNRCNFGCPWCLDNNRPSPNKGALQNEELTLEEITFITKRSGKKIPYIVLTGGEPFLRNDIAEIVLAFYKNTKTRFITINTNGSFPEKTYEQLEKILILCPGLNVNLQLTVSETKDNHDQIRVFKGSYDLLLESKKKIKILQKNYPNLIFTISTQVASEAIERFPKVIEAIKQDFSPDEHFISLIRETPKLITPPSGKAELMETYIFKLFKLYSKKRNLLQSIYNFVILHSIIEMNNIRSNRGKFYKCVAGKKFITLYENGNILPCENRQDLISGNIRNYNYDLSNPNLLKKVNDKYLQQNREKCQCDWGCTVSQNLITDPAFISKAIIKSLF